MVKILGLFDEFPFLTPSDKEDFVSKLEEATYEKGDLLEKAGQVSYYLYYLKSGAARRCYFRQNKDITVSFSLDGEFITSMHSFITHKPSFENIEVLEKSHIYKISYKDLQALLIDNPRIERAYRMILEKYYIILEEHSFLNKFKSARERYLDLMENRRKIIQKASVGQIASYLGMSIETLSRIRAKI
jgi:CRP-like cAMP-binding protein